MTSARRDDRRFQLAVFVLRDRLRHRLRFGAIDRDALLDQGAQSDAVDAAAEHGVDLNIPARARRCLTQRDLLKRAGFGVEKQQVFGTRQVRFEQRFETVGGIDRDTEFH